MRVLATWRGAGKESQVHGRRSWRPAGSAYAEPTSASTPVPVDQEAEELIAASAGPGSIAQPSLFPVRVREPDLWRRQSPERAFRALNRTAPSARDGRQRISDNGHCCGTRTRPRRCVGNHIRDPDGQWGEDRSESVEVQVAEVRSILKAAFRPECGDEARFLVFS